MAEAKPQLSGLASSHTASQLAGPLDLLEGMRCVVEERAAGLGQANASLRASEQIDSERPLKVADSSAERRLGDVQPCGRRPKCSSSATATK